LLQSIRDSAHADKRAAEMQRYAQRYRNLHRGSGSR
jgi:hypothetical protein